MTPILRNSLLRTPLRAVWDVAGYQTETLLWPASASKPKTILLFIPGNPGLVEYYTSFLEGIYQAIPSPAFEIIGVSHKGHSKNYHEHNSGDKNAYTLEDQIQHKLDCIDTLIKENGPETNFILVGHSVGSYISAEVLKKRPHHGISRVIALFPTLREIAITPNGVNINRLINAVPTSVFGIAGSLASYLAPPVRQFFVGVATGQSGDGLQVTAHQLMHSSVLKNVITMARCEMESIKDLDHDFYVDHLDKFVLYYSANDKWAPKDHHDYMIKHFPTGTVHLCAENIPHAFCLEPKHVDYMVEKVRSWIKSDIKKA
ncbi:uncharacterized protein EV154DRAFT_513811 [Mucor mucedo]|uniref:uncharacterized protein n=1 Tax=Mucor mucedo TaxID=29922 RepID=UPI00221EAE0A|nr:uncharacterized protein EV154DRAFT_513811 [Mucor mucedo]KAI7889701.1 hypothetical protein EV154DRAFT_513811 [Mucor mucedo]